MNNNFFDYFSFRESEIKILQLFSNNNNNQKNNKTKTRNKKQKHFSSVFFVCLFYFFCCSNNCLLLIYLCAVNWQKYFMPGFIFCVFVIFVVKLKPFYVFILFCFSLNFGNASVWSLKIDKRQQKKDLSYFFIYENK